MKLSVSVCFWGTCGCGCITSLIRQNIELWTTHTGKQAAPPVHPRRLSSSPSNRATSHSSTSSPPPASLTLSYRDGLLAVWLHLTVKSSSEDESRFSSSDGAWQESKGHWTCVVLKTGEAAVPLFSFVKLWRKRWKTFKVCHFLCFLKKNAPRVWAAAIREPRPSLWLPLSDLPPVKSTIRTALSHGGGWTAAAAASLTTLSVRLRQTTRWCWTTLFFSPKHLDLSNCWGWESTRWPTRIWQVCFSPHWREEHRGKKSQRRASRGGEERVRERCEAVWAKQNSTEDAPKKKREKKTTTTKKKKKKIPTEVSEDRRRTKEENADQSRGIASVGILGVALCQGECVLPLMWLLWQEMKQQLSTGSTYCLIKVIL